MPWSTLKCASRDILRVVAPLLKGIKVNLSHVNGGLIKHVEAVLAGSTKQLLPGKKWTTEYGRMSLADTYKELL